MKTQIRASSILLGLGALGISVPAHPYSIVTNESDFLAAWSAPATTIDFTHLKDGTTYADAWSSPFVAYRVSFDFAVYEDGWSNAFSIGGIEGPILPSASRSTVAMWNGDSISPSSNRFFVSFGRSEVPFSITYGHNRADTFLGFLPSGMSDGNVAVPPSVDRIWSLSFGYSPVVQAPVPESETYAMMIAGLGMIGFLARRCKTYRPKISSA